MEFKCTQCGYVHDGDAPPEVCPICGADKAKFIKRQGKLRLDIEGDS
ncbi:MAG: hypothetical protein PHR28_13050 [candidate division Zixibacteria bacterium]|nr:hypothetical protein [candidate division Zixibacteria bacterium]